MAEFNNDILDLDSIQEEGQEELDLSQGGTETEKVKPKERKKKYTKRSTQFSKTSETQNLLNVKKLSREERKNLQLLELFDKIEQKEKKKEENVRKKLKLNSEKSPNLSETHAESMQLEEAEKPVDTQEGISLKSEISSPTLEKAHSTKRIKSEPVKIASKFFNNAYDIGNSPNLINHLYEYQKTNAIKYSVPKKTKSMIKITPASNTTIVTNGNHKQETLLFKGNHDQIATLNDQLKKQNQRFIENLKKFESVDTTKDFRHLFYDLNSQ